MMIKSLLGLLPKMNAIKMLAGMAHGHLGVAMTPVVGCVIHFLSGCMLWGALFALLFYRLPVTASSLKGMVFGTFAWLVMMILVMLMTGAGLFGMHLGLGAYALDILEQAMRAPIATLMLHWVYGAVLGAVFAKLNTSQLIASHTRA